jgi:hypothetical protein
MSGKQWRCIGEECSEVLGILEGNELRVGASVPTITRMSNLVLTCPECGTQKIWYSSDPIVRAAYQIVDTLASEFARRSVQHFGKHLQPSSKEGDWRKQQ